MVSVTGDRHLGKAITPRLPGDLRDRGRLAARSAGVTLTAVVVAFVRWYVRDTDELPERPPRSPAS
jgi:hypothetical protein